jgi:hypothetical protein
MASSLSWPVVEKRSKLSSLLFLHV